MLVMAVQSLPEGSNHSDSRALPVALSSCPCCCCCVDWLVPVDTGLVVVFPARLAGGDDPEYDHLMPMYGERRSRALQLLPNLWNCAIAMCPAHVMTTNNICMVIPMPLTIMSTICSIELHTTAADSGLPAVCMEVSEGIWPAS